jgi:hypothetical protein
LYPYIFVKISDIFSSNGPIYQGRIVAVDISMLIY